MNSVHYSFYGNPQQIQECKLQGLKNVLVEKKNLKFWEPT
jgi:hypothetical protein